MHAFVRFRLPSGASADLGHGDIIGRLTTAALCVDDPRVSEAHAMVSVRRGELVLLALRRMFSVRAKPLSEAVLREGMTVELADGLSLVVEEVHQPEQALALSIEGWGTRTLSATASLQLGASPVLLPRFVPNADLHVWWNGASWRAQPRGGRAVEVSDGSALALGAVTARFALVSRESSATTTAGGPGGPARALRVIAWFDTVEIHREGRPITTLSGMGARMLSELVSIEAPVEWRVIAREVWSDATELEELRHRWDVTLARLRAKLKEAGVRSDLVRSTGGGLVQLVRYPGDHFEDRR